MPDPIPSQSVVRSTVQRYLDAHRNMVNGGVAVAVPAALDFCQKWRVPVPDWLIDASVELFCELLKNERPTRRGRTPTHVARARQDNIDFTRWSTVKWQRDAQKDLLDQVESIRQDPDCVGPGWREDREQQQKWFGTTLERAFECASMLLEGTDAFGSPDAIKRSYFKVERSSEDAATRHRYYQIDPQFLMKLGIKWEPFVRPGRKIEPLYKLSLGRN